jgi:tetratricopeptide (TPR) repeat protein
VDAAEKEASKVNEDAAEKKDSEVDEEALKKTIGACEQYLSYFPDSQQSRMMHLLMAEAFFDIKNYASAAEKYELVMELYSGMPEGEEAAFAALLSHELIVAQSGEKDIGKTEEAIERITEHFKSNYKGSKRNEEIVLKTADVYARMGYYAEAHIVLAPLLKGRAKAAAYKKAGDIYIAEKDLPRAIDSYTRALKISEDTELKKKLAKLHYRVAVDYAKKGSSKEAMKHYSKLSSNFEDLGLAENALTNVGRAYMENGDTDKFRAVLKVLKTNYPDSTGPLNLTVEAGKILEEKGRLKESANMFEEASAFAPEEDVAQRLILKAASLFESAEEYGGLERILNKHLKTGTITPERRTEVLYMLGTAQLRSGKKKKGMNTLSRLLSENKPDDFYVAKANLRLAEDKLQDFSKLKIEQPFDKSLMKKEALLRELLENFSYVIKSGIAELLPESYYNVGVVFENFKDSIIESERPKGLTSEELEEYEFLLEEKAYPFEEKAVKAYESGLKASIELGQSGVVSGLTTKAIERLAGLRPALYRRELDTGRTVLFVDPGPITEVK